MNPLHLPPHLPLEEALDYMNNYRSLPTAKEFRQTQAPISVGSFADYQIGECPVRKTSSMWVIDLTGQFWTNPTWHNEGHVSECWEGRRTISFGWPTVDKFDFSTITDMLMDHGHRWGLPGHTLTLAEIDGTHVGLWAGMDHDDVQMVRALMIYAFDQEWGREAFFHSCAAANLKHRRTTRRIRRKFMVAA